MNDSSNARRDERDERDERDARADRPRTAAEWYVALDARPRRSGDDAAHGIDASFAEWLTLSSAHEPALERCETAVALALALADDPDLAFAYAEARALAGRSRASALQTPAGRAGASFAGRSRRAARHSLAGLAAAAALVLVAATALVDRRPSPVDGAVATAAAIVASSPPLNGAVLLPNEFAVGARTLVVLPLVSTAGAGATGAQGRAFAAALERELKAALESVPGLNVLDAAPVPKNALDELPPSAIGALIGARGIVAGTMHDTPTGPELEIALLDASNDTLLWENRYPMRATSSIAADVIPSIAAALVGASTGDDSAQSARGTSVLASFGEDEGAVE